MDKAGVPVFLCLNDDACARKRHMCLRLHDTRRVCTHASSLGESPANSSMTEERENRAISVSWNGAPSQFRRNSRHSTATRSLTKAAKKRVISAHRKGAPSRSRRNSRHRILNPSLTKVAKKRVIPAHRHGARPRSRRSLRHSIFVHFPTKPAKNGAYAVVRYIPQDARSPPISAQLTSIDLFPLLHQTSQQLGVRRGQLLRTLPDPTSQNLAVRRGQAQRSSPISAELKTQHPCTIPSYTSKKRSVRPA
ncbi:hypothetical protein FOMPIDRAFT_1020428 [Fomitopsis schrenkii]|uniref:Uncharacterized protein n=1 Tax=Fomitopsis schrenkii TaxID=2126942 RepID=S8DRD5_FOMSC|nr:hypothetical protein FOMPIDRAFT_1020428 [Fomitopsis schrenkii]